MNGSYVLAALFTAVENGENLPTIKRLIDVACKVDLNVPNKVS